MAVRGAMERVEIQVAIAFGASVQPLTRITPSVRSTVINKAGLDVILDKKSFNVIVILPHSPKTEIFHDNIHFLPSESWIPLFFDYFVANCRLNSSSVSKYIMNRRLLYTNFTETAVDPDDFALSICRIESALTCQPDRLQIAVFFRKGAFRFHSFRFKKTDGTPPSVFTRISVLFEMKRRFQFADFVLIQVNNRSHILSNKDCACRRFGNLHAVKRRK